MSIIQRRSLQLFAIKRATYVYSIFQIHWRIHPKQILSSHGIVPLCSTYHYILAPQMDKDRLETYAISGMNYMYMHCPIDTSFNILVCNYFKFTQAFTQAFHLHRQITTQARKRMELCITQFQLLMVKCNGWNANWAMHTHFMMEKRLTTTKQEKVFA